MKNQTSNTQSEKITQNLNNAMTTNQNIKPKKTTKKN